MKTLTDVIDEWLDSWNSPLVTPAFRREGERMIKEWAIQRALVPSFEEFEAYIENDFVSYKEIYNYLTSRVRPVVWPSEAEIKDVAKHEDSDGYFGFLSGC